MAKQKYSFGELEQAIMDVAWQRPTVTVREVVDVLRARRVAYTTVMTVMNRLVAQRVLQRQPNGNGAFRYQARLSREKFYMTASRAGIDDLLRRYGTVALAQFVDRLDRVPNEKLNALRRKLRASQE